MNGDLKSKIHPVAMILLAVSLLLFAGTAAASEPIAIPDPKLEQAIRDELDQPTEEITMEDMERIIDLDARGRDIEDLTGLEYALNLEALGLSRNMVSDIRVLENLQNLEWLHLSENQIRDIGSLQSLSNLEWLAFNDNQVSDIGVLENLTNLKQLFFGSNQVSEITAVGNLTNLDRVLFPDNQVSDISVLENLTSLRYLDFSSNQVSEVTPLGGLRNLERLLFPDNQVSDIGALENLTNLQVLSMANNQIKNIAVLQQLTSLQELDVRFNGLDIARDSDAMRLIQQLIEDGVNVDFLPQMKVPVDDIIDKGAGHIKMTIGDLAYEIDGTPAFPAMDVPPFIENGRTFVPVRFLAEAFAAAADWTPKNANVETVYLERADLLITIRIGQASLEIYDKMNDETKTATVDAPARIVEGRTFLPFRAIGEAFGVEVDYSADPETGLVEQVWFTQEQ